MEMDDSSSPAADFVDYLGPDTSATVFTMIHHPADLARASAVSRSWRQFVIDNHFTKLQCLRACPEVSTFTAVDVTTSRRTTLQDQDQHSAAQSNTTAENLHRVYSHLAHGLLSPYNPRDCILHCIGASSTDNFPEETVENTLEPVDQLDTSRPSYWSSGGQRDPDAAECLIYRLQADLCLIHEIKVQPFKAFFQHGDPIYSPKSIRVQMGYPRSPLRPEALVSDENEGQLIHDTNYVWTYTSPEFPMLQENVLQSFTLPRPVLCIGGVVKVELLGRVQKQAIDGLYYICISHVQIAGKALSRDLGVVPRGDGLVLNYYLDPRTCGVPRIESSRVDGRSRWQGLASRIWHSGTARGIGGLNQTLLSRLFGGPLRLVVVADESEGEEDEDDLP
ncbi:F-box protein At4g00755-like [Hordeum vulgare subsp. vulgare]|uniref:F-box domain-containing protein n=1 Tax=Hordeum vulgare subsp. vulgare TaxID=112509 RepID=A0A8I6YPI1_HORVV|nr:F-box protein At4g00755-like [Hordeum vulgare subsp. vulgare]